MKDIIFITPIVLLIIGAVIVIAVCNYRIRKRVLESGPIDERALQFLKSLAGAGSEVLKWGLILLCGGIGLIIVAFIPYNFNESSLPYGIEAIFIAIGFLIYYFIVKRQ